MSFWKFLRIIFRFSQNWRKRSNLMTTMKAVISCHRIIEWDSFFCLYSHFGSSLRSGELARGRILLYKSNSFLSVKYFIFLKAAFLPNWVPQGRNIIRLAKVIRKIWTILLRPKCLLSFNNVRFQKSSCEDFWKRILPRRFCLFETEAKLVPSMQEVSFPYYFH